MATVVITEAVDLSYDSKGNPVPVMNLSDVVASTELTFSTSTQHTLDVRTRFIRVKSAADFHIKEGENPTATTDDAPVEANVAEYFGVQTKTKRNRKLAIYDGTS